MSAAGRSLNLDPVGAKQGSKQSGSCVRLVRPRDTQVLQSLVWAPQNPSASLWPWGMCFSSVPCVWQ